MALAYVLVWWAAITVIFALPLIIGGLTFLLSTAVAVMDRRHEAHARADAAQ